MLTCTLNSQKYPIGSYFPLVCDWELRLVRLWSDVLTDSFVPYTYARSFVLHFFITPTCLFHPFLSMFQFLFKKKKKKVVSNHQIRIVKLFLHSFGMKKHVSLLLTHLHYYFFAEFFKPVTMNLSRVNWLWKPDRVLSHNLGNACIYPLHVCSKVWFISP